MRCYHPTDLGRSCGFCLNCQTAADMRDHDDARDAQLFLELGTRELGARATLCPIMLATIGLDWEAVKAIACDMVGAWRVNPVATLTHLYDVRATERARLDAVQNAGQAGRAWEC